jgi:hypothetical protein
MHLLGGQISYNRKERKEHKEDAGESSLCSLRFLWQS